MRRDAVGRLGGVHCFQRAGSEAALIWALLGGQRADIQGEMEIVMDTFYNGILATTRRSEERRITQ